LKKHKKGLNQIVIARIMIITTQAHKMHKILMTNSMFLNALFIFFMISPYLVLFTLNIKNLTVSGKKD